MDEILIGVAITVIGGLLLAAILAGEKWLRHQENRSTLRQRICRHRWEPYLDHSGDGVVFITP